MAFERTRDSGCRRQAVRQPCSHHPSTQVNSLFLNRTLNTCRHSRLRVFASDRLLHDLVNRKPAAVHTLYLVSGRLRPVADAPAQAGLAMVLVASEDLARALPSTKHVLSQCYINSNMSTMFHLICMPCRLSVSVAGETAKFVSHASHVYSVRIATSVPDAQEAAGMYHIFSQCCLSRPLHVDSDLVYRSALAIAACVLVCLCVKKSNPSQKWPSMRPIRMRPARAPL